MKESISLSKVSLLTGRDFFFPPLALTNGPFLNFLSFLTPLKPPCPPTLLLFLSILMIYIFQIRYVRASDAGSYECQVSTVPKISKLFHLKVVIPKVCKLWMLRYESPVKAVKVQRSHFTIPESKSPSYCKTSGCKRNGCEGTLSRIIR